MLGERILEIHPFLSFNIAVMLLLTGKGIVLRSSLLRQYSIPEPVVGGVLCAAFVAFVYLGFDRQIRFGLEVRDFLLLVFFAGIGLKSEIATLAKGGRPLVILLALAAIFMVAQNFLGVAVAAAFGINPLAGLMAGSISLTGGVGTTAAWAPIFVGDLGISNAMELGVASNMVGLIAACLVGGPIAAFLLQRHQIKTSGGVDLDIGAPHDTMPQLDYFGVLWAILILNITVVTGVGIDALVTRTGLNLPTFVSCLVAGIVLRNLSPLVIRTEPSRYSAGISQGLALISDLSLGLFLTMALMGLQLWALADVFSFIVIVLVLQIIRKRCFDPTFNWRLI